MHGEHLRSRIQNSSNANSPCRTSASNCARIYNEMAEKVRFKNLLPHDYPKKLELDVETVWNSLFLFWLIEDHSDSQRPVLVLDHNEATQALRLEGALQDRNLRMVGTGQEEWSHVCDLCCEIKKASDGRGALHVTGVFHHGRTYSFVRNNDTVCSR